MPAFPPPPPSLCAAEVVESPSPTPAPSPAPIPAAGEAMHIACVHMLRLLDCMRSADCTGPLPAQMGTI